MPSRTQLAKRRTMAYPPLVVQELDALEKALGGRQDLVSLLALAPLTDDLRYILGLLGDPLHQGLSLAVICAKGNLLPGDLLKFIGAAALHRGQTLSKQKIGDSIPAVVADVMRKAAPYQAACHSCMGTGSFVPEPTPDQPNPSPGPCETCRGTGQLIYQPDLETQKLAIEMAGLSQRGGGIHLTNQQLTLPLAGGGGAGALEQLQALTDQILYGEGGLGSYPPGAAADAAGAPIDADLVTPAADPATPDTSPTDPGPEWPEAAPAG